LIFSGFHIGGNADEKPPFDFSAFRGSFLVPRARHGACGRVRDLRSQLCKLPLAHSGALRNLHERGQFKMRQQVHERLQERQGKPEVHHRLRQKLPGRGVLPRDIFERQRAMPQQLSRLQERLHGIALISSCCSQYG
jgi:hypothetical protein